MSARGDSQYQTSRYGPVKVRPFLLTAPDFTIKLHIYHQNGKNLNNVEY